MTNILLEAIITALIGSSLVVGGVVLHADDAINSAKSAVNAANVHQFATVLELYYDDHQTYPRVSGGEPLVRELFQGGYIRSKPLDASVFRYEPRDGGQDYSLTLNWEIFL